MLQFSLAMSKEADHGGEHSRRPLQPNKLSPELAEFLRPQEYVMLKHATDQGTIFVVKAPEREINSVTGPVLMKVFHELYQEPEAPVIRSVVNMYDRPDNPLSLETFTNVRDEQQRSDFDTLAKQKEYLFLFYNENLQHQLSKRLNNPNGKQMSKILELADRRSSILSDATYNFDQAKARVMSNTKL